MKFISNNRPLGSRVIWFHCSSLGEYEQSIPLIKKIKEKLPSYKIAITFFSISGFSNKLEKHLCDWSGYLPLENSNKIVKLTNFINPKLMVLVKNEFWPILLDVLNKKKNICYFHFSQIQSSTVFFSTLGYLVFK